MVGEADCQCNGKREVYTCEIFGKTLLHPLSKPGYRFNGEWVSMTDHAVCRGCKSFVPSKPKPKMVRLIDPVILEVLPKSKHERAIVVIAPDARTQKELAITRPAIQEYCAVHRLDYVEVSQLYRQEHPCGNKYALNQVAMYYDRVTLVDADVAIMADSPNIFDEVPTRWGLFNELARIREVEPNWMATVWDELADATGIPRIPVTVGYNCGVMVAPSDPGKQYFPPEQPVPFDWCVEQNWLTRQLIDQKQEVTSLDWRWNCGYPWRDWPDRIKDAYFIHLNGCHPLPRRLQLLQNFSEGKRTIPKDLIPGLKSWIPGWK